MSFSAGLILSYGVVDQMADVPGFAESWGTSIVPCPYCDGFEVAGQHWGLVWSGPQSHNQARLFFDWTDTLTVLSDAHGIAPDISELRARHGLSQREYADLLGIDVRTLQNWEQGRNRPDPAALSLMRIFAHAPAVFEEALSEPIDE